MCSGFEDLRNIYSRSDFGCGFWFLVFVLGFEVIRFSYFSVYLFIYIFILVKLLTIRDPHMLLDINFSDHFSITLPLWFITTPDHLSSQSLHLFGSPYHLTSPHHLCAHQHFTSLFPFPRNFSLFKPYIFFPAIYPLHNSVVCVGDV